MVKLGTITAALLGFVGAIVATSFFPRDPDSLGIRAVLMPIILFLAWFYFSCLAWAPCLLTAVLVHRKSAPAKDLENAWNFFAASLLPFAVCLCILVGFTIKRRGH